MRAQPSTVSWSVNATAVSFVSLARPASSSGV
jgi:hypothetical protein